jgi:hypothetical protein
MNTDFTQHHHWGVIEHGVRTQVFQDNISDEYLWEFLQPEELLENLFGIATVNQWLSKGGGFELVDEPNPLPRFHKITVWAYHPDPRQLTLIQLQRL